ncbi:MAG: threonine synthase [Planctomycetes bacterium]|nr:threonine synthase [Planctomycetota bacterium]
MSEPIRFYSTNHQTPAVTLAEALLQGQAPDRGLFMPETVPAISSATLAAWADKTYPDLAHAVLLPFAAGVFDDQTLAALCTDAYDYDVPLEPVTQRRYLMRLDRGPTASFKDFAARLMARWMSVLNRDVTGDLLILTATSGDTGSAVAHAYHGVERVRVVVLFPVAEVSDRQRKQMTTIGGNVTTLGIDGKFDDCQAMVKRAFSDPALAALRLTSANSINIGRLLPQAVYYVYAYAKLAEATRGEPLLVSVPSGNFGDMMGAVLARRMGLPIQRLIIATNANDEVPVFLRTGVYQKIVPSRVCISNAMNVGHPSNLARLVDVYGGHMDETGHLHKSPDLERMRGDLYAVSISDDETRATIKAAYETHGTILEPHGAVGWAGLARYVREHPEHAATLAVSVETAHPAKFPEEIRATLGIEPEVPPSLAGLEECPESYETYSAEYEPFRDMLLREYT